ncbi:hypothetical protein PISL3812_01726 [Talaromyces islandicus]|uniref:DUF4604 domain-containing protein n=1 Tax=Talaromyces islandicus TaxID=28573 RepID=A0A0U1LMW6_TALIS|nr:hypothetical protein PISL3812_01726 [Talaromyces islandicus]
MAFNSKNLSYDRQEPAFLRKLRGESSGVDSPRQERFSQRPRKPKNKDDDDDDAPTYVDEETNDTITKEDYEALLKGSEKDKSQTTLAEGDGDIAPGESKEPAASSEQANVADAPKAQEKMAEIGSQKRKKQARVVGGDDDEVAAEDEASRKDSSSSRRPKAKRKKVKLSFDDA